jgi:citronellyl-CoA dehydrogenase
MGGEQAAGTMEIVTEPSGRPQGAPRSTHEADRRLEPGIKTSFDSQSERPLHQRAGCWTTASSTRATRRTRAGPDARHLPRGRCAPLRARCSSASPACEGPDHAPPRSVHPEHDRFCKTSAARFIDREINPFVDAWEEEEIFPAHEVFKKMGDAGLPRPQQAGGVRRPGPRLLLRRSCLCRGARPTSRCGGVPMAIGVQTDMATPALARFGSDELRRVPRPLDQPATWSACIGVSESAPAPTSPRSRPPPARTATTTSSTAARCGSPTARRPTGCACSPTPPMAPHKNKSLICVPMKTKGVERGEEARRSSACGRRHRPDLLRRGARAAALPHRRGGHGLHLPDAAVPGGAAVGRRQLGTAMAQAIDADHRVHPRAQGLRQAASSTTSTCTSSWPSCRPRSRPCAPGATRASELVVAGEDVTRLASMAKLKAGRLHPRGRRLAACSSGAAWATCGTARSAACGATGASPPSAAAPTR